MSSLSYLELARLAGPEALLALTAVAVLGVDLGIMRAEPRPNRRLMGATVTAVGCLVAMLWLFHLPAGAQLPGGVLVLDPLARWMKGALIVLTLFTVALSLHADFTEHIGEYFALILLATVGMLFLASTQELLMLFVAIELTSLCLYILTALNKRNRRSVEAALKYFLFGGVAAAFTLFGISLLYGLTGSTRFAEVAPALGRLGSDPLLSAALAMVLIGFGFKVAAVPFHLWAPDAYEGAPTPAAALIASGSKVASFIVFGRLLVHGVAGVQGSAAWGDFTAGWVPMVAVVAAASMVLGNLAALAQQNLRRLVAYSAIAHAGYALLALVAAGTPARSDQALAALAYYVLTYALTSVGLFGVVGVLERHLGSSDLADLAGLSRRAPDTAFCLLVFVLSLAGIPPLAGFFGKFYAFTAAASADARPLGLFWLVILALLLSAVSLFYYLLVLKQAYVVASTESPRLPVAWSDRLVLWVLALLVLAAGLAPQALLTPLLAAARLALPQ